LLLLLHCDEVHGYELLDNLNPFGFEQNPVDLSTVYRLLRHLEDGGLVVSRWDTSNPGPARRLYRLTEEGDRYLAWWVKDLHETERVLHSFLATYESHMESHQGDPPEGRDSTLEPPSAQDDKNLLPKET